MRHLKFQHAILATGSQPVPFPDKPFAQGSRIMSSSGALALPDIPERLLILGGGYIGLELGTVYAALGTRVTMVEAADRLLPGVDPDLVRPLYRSVESMFAKIFLNETVVSLQEQERKVEAVLEAGGRKSKQSFDRVLVAIGRKPNSRDIGLENTAVKLDDKGFVIVDEQQRTADPKIFAVGDVSGGMMLAHKAMREGKIAAEVIAGRPAAFDARAIPAVVYTDPQIAWTGLTEGEAAEIFLGNE